MLMNESLYELYRYLENNTIGIDIDIKTYKKYLYLLDVLHLNTTYTPFIWEDYIFIEDEFDLYSSRYTSEISEIHFSQNNYNHQYVYDNLSEMSVDFLYRILYENQIDKLTDREIKSIYHMDHIPKEANALLYYEESRENYFLFDNGAYELKLLQKKREISIRSLIN